WDILQPSVQATQAAAAQSAAAAAAATASALAAVAAADASMVAGLDDPESLLREKNARLVAERAALQESNRALQHEVERSKEAVKSLVEVEGMLILSKMQNAEDASEILQLRHRLRRAEAATPTPITPTKSAKKGFYT
ncbi:hypothetical protein T484DRAFT_1823460, partial [Baffinella frigidus]